MLLGSFGLCRRNAFVMQDWLEILTSAEDFNWRKTATATGPLVKLTTLALPLCIYWHFQHSLYSSACLSPVHKTLSPLGCHCNKTVSPLGCRCTHSLYPSLRDQDPLTVPLRIRHLPRWLSTCLFVDLPVMLTLFPEILLSAKHWLASLAKPTILVHNSR